MKQKRASHDAVVTVTISPQSISCTYIKSLPTGTAPFVLAAYERHELTHLELESLILFNPTRIAQYVTKFIAKNSIYNPFVICTLQGPLLFEKYVTLSARSPHRSDFPLEELQGRLWDYQYIYPTEHGDSVFYVAGLPRALIAQYQIWALTAGLNLVALIPASLTLLHVYRYVHGAAFRRTQLALDMLQHHNITDYFCTADTLSRLVTVAPSVVIDRAHDIRPILIACGAFISEGLSDEKY